MKVLFIGVGIGPKLLQKITEKNGKILSAQVSCGNLVEGLDRLNIDMDTLNGPNVSTQMLPVIEAENWRRNENGKDLGVGYRNIKYLNNLFKQKALCAAAKKWAKENEQQEQIVIYVYGMHTPFIAAACEVKKRLPQAKICLIVPDLPQYMDLKMSRVKKVLKALDWRRIQGYMKKIDKYVLYAEPMAAFLGLRDDQWIVMEGSYDSNQLASKEVRPVEDKVAVMYSGVLDMRYGIPELLDAMNLLDENYLLWLTGAGNAVPLIQERAEADPRICFYGFLPSRQDLLDKQAQATMLISPRRDTEEASRYCFPSKLFEYMVSGRPVISCLLDGIPKEYHAHLQELPGVTPEEIARVIKEVAEMPAAQRAENGEKARAFVMNEKNKYAQAKKIADFMGVSGKEK